MSASSRWLPERAGRVAAAGAALMAALALAACGGGGGGHGAPPPGGGRQVFVSTGCGRCHTLSAAGTHGGIGPNFDTSERLTRAQMRQAITNGGNGMPSFAGRLSPAELDAVIGFLYRATH